MSKINNIHLEVSKLLEKTIVNQFNPKINISPIRTMQALKSLIGINLDLNYSEVLKWANQYLDNNTIENKNESYNITKSEMLSIHDLEAKIRMKDRIEAITYLKKILLVSEGKNILEFLLEISLLQTGKSTLVIWSIIKTLYFLKFENLDIALIRAIDSMIDDDFLIDINKNKNKINWEKELVSHRSQIHLILLLYQINSFDFIRKEKIKNNIHVMINNIKDCKKIKFQSTIMPCFESKEKLPFYLIKNVNRINYNEIIYLDLIRIIFDNFRKENYLKIN